MADLLDKATIRRRILVRAGMHNSDYVTDVDVDDQAQASAKKLWNKLVKTYESFFIKECTEQQCGRYSDDLHGTKAGEKNYYFPADYLKLRDIVIGSVPAVTGGDGITVTAGKGPWRRLTRIEHEDEYRINSNDATGKPQSYIAYGRADVLKSGARANGFRLVVTPDIAYPLRILYIPVCPWYDEFDFINGAVEFIIADSAIALCDSEKSDCSVLMAERGESEETILSAFSNRDAGQAPQFIGSSPVLSEDYAEMAYE